MLLSKKGCYALQAMIYLAKHENKRPNSIRDISESEGISRKFLETILLELRKGGLVESKKGKGGGYSLCKEARLITVKSILALVEGLHTQSLWNHADTDEEILALNPSSSHKVLSKLGRKIHDCIEKITENTSLFDLIAWQKNIEEQESRTLMYEI